MSAYFYNNETPDYVKSSKNINHITSDSLMNIAYLTNYTNSEISNKNPLDYISEFDKNPNFEQVINSHLLPKQIIQWSRMDEMPANALDQFIEIRIEKIIKVLENKILNITFDIRDERANKENQ